MGHESGRIETLYTIAEMDRRMATVRGPRRRMFGLPAWRFELLGSPVFGAAIEAGSGVRAVTFRGYRRARLAAWFCGPVLAPRTLDSDVGVRDLGFGLGEVAGALFFVGVGVARAIKFGGGCAAPVDRIRLADWGARTRAGAAGSRGSGSRGGLGARGAVWGIFGPVAGALGCLCQGALWVRAPPPLGPRRIRAWAVSPPRPGPVPVRIALQ